MNVECVGRKEGRQCVSSAGAQYVLDVRTRSSARGFESFLMKDRSAENMLQLFPLREHNTDT